MLSHVINSRRTVNCGIHIIKYIIYCSLNIDHKLNLFTKAYRYTVIFFESTHLIKCSIAIPLRFVMSV